ncbi:site-specific DNA-methyltransferase (adenine-specific) [Dysgonomonas sp. PH5-45]|uniref:DNA methyltransferase n=1 Tax=unclassified Dysgonomonas TaxID=2630389 RepID=UPI002473D39A|nr:MULTISPECIES: DNA methyltransferase [unclassified Dysgonomonas]MDH6354697.1 site-specific DNA-methyltransferase (adenine-specific) [Dysgonomonas sp. PH5-45]MDH6387595.1 site-specific DNA-methyltransferase (adenine-specific) [Dysgonomonas sp. PH5-37]
MISNFKAETFGCVTLIEGDCYEIMDTFYPFQFDLAIPDVDYGLDVTKMPFTKRTVMPVKQKNGKSLNVRKSEYKQKDWDLKTPGLSYFEKLFDVSVHQIIWGIDYLNIPNIGNGRIKWDKCVPEKLSFKGFERAYCSLLDSEIDIKLLWSGFRQAKSLEEPTIQQGNKKLNEKRIHPTQKPVLLYKRLLLDYAKPGWKILDTHGGSMSLAIACFDLGYEVVIIEKDSDYFTDGRDRLIKHITDKKI